MTLGAAGVTARAAITGVLLEGAAAAATVAGGNRDAGRLAGRETAVVGVGVGVGEDWARGKLSCNTDACGDVDNPLARPAE